MKFYSLQENNFEITTNPDKIDIDSLHNLLAYESYWNQNIPKEILMKGIKNSLNFSLIDTKEKKFIGFARAITDYATFAYLCDVIIDKSYQGKGLGKWLIRTIMNHSELQGLKFWFLITKDAHSLYSQFGWKPLENPEIAMAIKIDATDLYKPRIKE